MLRDYFFDRLFRIEPRENGVNRIVRNAPDDPETTVEHAMTAAADTLPDPFARLAREEDTEHAFNRVPLISNDHSKESELLES